MAYMLGNMRGGGGELNLGRCGQLLITEGGVESSSWIFAYIGTTQVCAAPSNSVFAAGLSLVVIPDTPISAESTATIQVGEDGEKVPCEIVYDEAEELYTIHATMPDATEDDFTIIIDYTV